MKPRQNIYLDDDLNRHLEALAAKPGTSKSAIIRDALTAYLARRGAKELQDAFSKRLNELTTQLNTVQRHQLVLIESVALFIRFQLGMVPPLPAAEQSAANALGTERFQVFIAQVSRRIAEGKNWGSDVIERAKKDNAPREPSSPQSI